MRNMTYITIDFISLPTDTIDEDYEDGHVYLLSLVEEAKNNNPVVEAYDNMPLNRSYNGSVHVPI